MNAQFEVPRLLTALRARIDQIALHPATRQEIIDLTDEIRLVSCSSGPIVDSQQWDGCDMTKSEIAVIDLLNSHFGRLVARESLMQQLYGARNDPPIGKTLDAFLSHIRAKLKAHKSPYAIQNDFGRGWKLVRVEDWKPSADRQKPYSKANMVKRGVA